MSTLEAGRCANSQARIEVGVHRAVVHRMIRPLRDLLTGGCPVSTFALEGTPSLGQQALTSLKMRSASALLFGKGAGCTYR